MKYEDFVCACGGKEFNLSNGKKFAKCTACGKVYNGNGICVNSGKNKYPRFEVR